MTVCGCVGVCVHVCVCVCVCVCMCVVCIGELSCQLYQKSADNGKERPLHTQIFHENLCLSKNSDKTLSLVPRPHLSGGKGSGRIITCKSHGVNLIGAREFRNEISSSPESARCIPVPFPP